MINDATYSKWHGSTQIFIRRKIIYTRTALKYIKRYYEINICIVNIFFTENNILLTCKYTVCPWNTSL